MGRFVNPDNSAFQVALNSRIYVDKTGLIEYTNSVLDTTNAYICNSRPRRFGKSYAANMLAAYYSKGTDSEQMFSGLRISKDADFKKHLNKYDVIHIDIQWFLANCDDADKVVSFITKSVLDELRGIYPDALPQEVVTLPDALSRVKERTGQKFVVIIDEWDVIIRDGAITENIQDEYLNFLRGMFKGVEPTKYIQLAYLTGILPIKKERAQSAVNNLDEFTMLQADELAPYIGFTENEVKGLCEKYNRDFDKVKKWYDGYLLGNEHVYNPKAVVSYLNFHILQSYWTQTSSYESINSLIKMNFDGLKDAIIQMLSGSQVEVRTTTFQNDMISFKNKDDVLTALVHLGYLGYNQTYRTVFIPNEEIRQEFVNSVSEDKWNDLILFEKESSKILDATLDLDEETVAIGIEKIHNTYASNITYHNENSLSCVLTLAYLSTLKYYFKPIRELPTGRGFADFVYIPKPEYKEYYPALLVELKWNQNVQSALDQIQNKEYPQSIQDYTENLLLIGINYDKKTKKHIVKIRHKKILVHLHLLTTFCHY